MIKAIFIDIDDTLLDFDAYVKQTMEAGFRRFGFKAYEPSMFDVFETINNALWDDIEQGKLDFEGLRKIRFNQVFKALGIHFDGEVFEEYFRACIWNSAIEVEGAIALLQSLKEHYILCAASNGPYEQQLHRLEIGGMKDCFQACFISEALGVSKPEKAFFEKALAALNSGREESILAKECIMLGDSLRSDIAGGKHAGMKTVWFNRRGVENNSGVQPDITVRTLDEVKALGAAGFPGVL